VSDFYNTIKAEISKRHEDRRNECRDLNDAKQILRSQGAARDLEQLLSVMERMEHPQKEGDE